MIEACASARRNAQRGVTLVELLIALLVFAMIASVGVYAVRLAVDGRAQLVEADSALREWQIARLIMRQDFSQLAPRIVRDEFGNPQAGAVVAGIGFSGRQPVIGETPLVGFVRGGWSNYTARSPRSTLQYVEYLTIDGAIIRRMRPYLDDARDQPHFDRVLFAEVSDVEMTFLLEESSRGLEWVENWPPTGGGGLTRSAPAAVKLVFTSPRYGRVEQLFWIGSIAAGATS